MHVVRLAVDHAYIKLVDRTILMLRGRDAGKLLHSIASNTVREGLIYNAIFSPQGRIITDFFVCPYKDGYLLDCAVSFAIKFIALLKKYVLASDVVVDEMTDFAVYSLFFSGDGGLIFPDPRNSIMGYRGYLAAKDILWPGIRAGLPADYEKQRILSFIPEVHKDMQSNVSYPLDYFLDEYNAIDFNKGCYIGQEVTCRMYYRRARRKILCNVRLCGSLDCKPGTDLYLHGNKIGIMGSAVDDLGLALVDRVVLATIQDDVLTELILDDGIKIIAYKDSMA